MTSEQLKNKAWKVVYSCKTPAHAKAAMQYISLLAAQYPDLDVSPLHQELSTLFNWN